MSAVLRRAALAAAAAFSGRTRSAPWWARNAIRFLLENLPW